MSNSVLTVAEVAARLKIKPKTVRKLIRSGQLKASNIGSKKGPLYAIREAFLIAFLKEREVVGIEDDGCV